MSSCDLDIVLYFYDEMDPDDRARTAAHLQTCAACRQRLEDLDAIRRALAARPSVDAPPAGDWSGFMRRLDAAVLPARPQAQPGPSILPQHQSARWPVRQMAALAAMLVLVTVAILGLARYRTIAPITPTAQTAVSTAPATAPAVATGELERDRSLREESLEHLERSKLVVLGLTSRDPRRTKAGDWQYERRLAGSLLSDTRLYRIAAQDRGVNDVARVMRDLETVLLETSLSDSSDRGALERLQHLIARRDLVMKMQVIATTGSAGI